MQLKKIQARLQFDVSKMSVEDINKLHQAQSLLNEIGVVFDTGGTSEFRDWEFDWSLKGPVKVFLHADGN